MSAGVRGVWLKIDDRAGSWVRLCARLGLGFPAGPVRYADALASRG